MEKELIHEVENKLVEIVGRSNVYVKASPIPEFDWMLCIRGYEFLCEVKKTVTRSNFGSIQMKLRTWQENTDKPILLVAQNIYPLLMDEFAHQGINCLDSAGNCRIKVGDLLMHIEGRKVPPKFQATSAIEVVVSGSRNKNHISYLVRAGLAKSVLSADATIYQCFLGFNNCYNERAFRIRIFVEDEQREILKE